VRAGVETGVLLLFRVGDGVGVEVGLGGGCVLQEARIDNNTNIRRNFVKLSPYLESCDFSSRLYLIIPPP
jgi:hypothetical protein